MFPTLWPRSCSSLPSDRRTEECDQLPSTPERRRHLKKDIEAALRFAKAGGWIVEEIHRGHRWGILRGARNSSNTHLPAASIAGYALVRTTLSHPIDQH